MRSDVLYRRWRLLACALSIASGIALWGADARIAGACGVATGVFHALWGSGLRARLQRRRRPIVIAHLRPIVVAPSSSRCLAQRLRARGVRRDAVTHG